MTCGISCIDANYCFTVTSHVTYEEALVRRALALLNVFIECKLAKVNSLPNISLGQLLGRFDVSLHKVCNVIQQNPMLSRLPSEYPS